MFDVISCEGRSELIPARTPRYRKCAGYFIIGVVIAIVAFLETEDTDSDIVYMYTHLNALT